MWHSKLNSFDTAHHIHFTVLNKTDWIEKVVVNVLTHMSGSWIIRSRYFFFWASFPAMMTGICPSEFASIAVWIAVQPYASSSVIIHTSIKLMPNPPKKRVDMYFKTTASHQMDSLFTIFLRNVAVHQTQLMSLFYNWPGVLKMTREDNIMSWSKQKTFDVTTLTSLDHLARSIVFSCHRNHFFSRKFASQILVAFLILAQTWT